MRRPRLVGGLLIAATLAVAACQADPAATGAPTGPATAALPTDDATSLPAPQTERPGPSPTSAPTEAASPSGMPTDASTNTPEPTRFPAMDFALSSTAFQDGGDIPSSFTCDGADQPIPLSWSEPPDGTAELALIFHDPDAGGFVHWVVVGIPPDVMSLDGGLPAGVREGRNDFGGTGYRGPCPPSGTHGYVLTLFALSAPLAAGDPVTARDVRQAADGTTLARAQLRGSYRRSR